MNDCPKCYRSLGLVRASIVHVGALLEHTTCKAVLVVTAVKGPTFDVRVATDAEREAAR